jgi:hypothetical protein
MDSKGACGMSLALKRLQNIGWFALVFFVAILLYPLSMNVASVHSDLVSVDNKIRNTKREIDFLQAELRTRASMAQLQEWNQVLYGYEPPSAQQFLDGESALASLNGGAALGKPVMVSVAAEDGTRPAGVIGSPFAKMASAETSQPASNVSVDSSRGLTTEIDKPTNSAKPLKKVEAIITTRTEKLASMDQKLLSDDLLKDIQKKSAAERKRR